MGRTHGVHADTLGLKLAVWGEIADIDPISLALEDLRVKYQVPLVTTHISPDLERRHVSLN